MFFPARESIFIENNVLPLLDKKNRLCLEINISLQTCFIFPIIKEILLLETLMRFLSNI